MGRGVVTGQQQRILLESNPVRHCSLTALLGHGPDRPVHYPHIFVQCHHALWSVVDKGC